jgi:hypothetical protein
MAGESKDAPLTRRSFGQRSDGAFEYASYLLSSENFLGGRNGMVHEHFRPELARGFSCVAIPNGFSWTLTQQLGELLNEAETRFGPRDEKWTPVGIEFCGDIPKVWYPGNRNHISIMLTDNAREDSRQALFQLSHEVVHLLAPTGNNSTLIIEEGLATSFSTEISVRYGLDLHYDVPSYVNAQRLVRVLVEAHPEGIKRIREREMYFYKFTPDIILEFCPTVPVDVAEELCRPFVRD